MKIEIAIGPVTPDVKQAIEDAWVAILRAELEARAERPEHTRAIVPTILEGPPDGGGR